MAKVQAYQISIPKPCHEDWNMMTVAEKGRFCNACQKNVIDFSKMSDAEIIKIIEKSTGGLCGKFTPTQLNRDIYIGEYNSSFPLKSNVLAGVLALATLHPVMANVSSANPIVVAEMEALHSYSENLEPQYENLDHDSTKYKIKGMVVDPANKPVAFVNVVVDDVMIKGTSTDGNGFFELDVKKNDKLKISYVGFESQFVIVDEKIISEKQVMIKLKDVIGMKGAVIIRKRHNIRGREVIYMPTETETRFLLNK